MQRVERADLRRSEKECPYPHSNGPDQIRLPLPCAGVGVAGEGFCGNPLDRCAAPRLMLRRRAQTAMTRRLETGFPQDRRLSAAITGKTPGGHSTTTNPLRSHFREIASNVSGFGARPSASRQYILWTFPLFVRSSSFSGALGRIPSTSGFSPTLRTDRHGHL
jgi:hypothetical protein